MARWLSEHPSFQDIYVRAREAQADLMDAEILDVARQDPGRVVVSSGDGSIKEHVDTGEVQHRRLLIDALKWRAAHLKPKVYGRQAQSEPVDGASAASDDAVQIVIPDNCRMTTVAPK